LVYTWVVLLGLLAES